MRGLECLPSLNSLGFRRFSQFPRNLQKINYFKKFTMAEPFASAHFAIAHWKDIFPENFFMSKSTPASVGPRLT